MAPPVARRRLAMQLAWMNRFPRQRIGAQGLGSNALRERERNVAHVFEPKNRRIYQQNCWILLDVEMCCVFFWYFIYIFTLFFDVMMLVFKSSRSVQILPVNVRVSKTLVLSNQTGDAVSQMGVQPAKFSAFGISVSKHFLGLSFPKTPQACQSGRFLNWAILFEYMMGTPNIFIGNP